MLGIKELKRNLKSMRNRVHPLLIGLIVLGFLIGTCSVVLVEDFKDYHYDFINVDINILANSDMEITETQKFIFTSGDFHHGYCWLPLDKVDSIEGVEVWENGRKYPQNPAVKEWIDTQKKEGGSGGGDTYAFTTWTEDNKLWIGWWFPQTRGGSRTFRIRYLVHGGLAIYEEVDRLHWKVIFKDRDAPIMSGRVIVHFPKPLSPERLMTASDGVATQSKIIDGRTIEFTTDRISQEEELKIKVIFPHGIVAGDVPQWQKKSHSHSWFELLFISLALLFFLLWLFYLIRSAGTRSSGNGGSGIGGEGDSAGAG